LAQNYIGAPIKRLEDRRFITGKGSFVDDVKLPRMAHAAFLRSDRAHARIISINVNKARRMPGVMWVATLEDIGEIAARIPMRMYELSGFEGCLQPLLAHEKVRYVGEPIAIAVAETRHLAEDSLDAIEVTYEDLPAVNDIRAGMNNEVLVHEKSGTNLTGVHEFCIGDVDDAFRNAEYIRREEFKVHRFSGVPLETRGLVAHFDRIRNEMTIWGITKLLHYNRRAIALFLGFPEHKLHILEGDIGGGFGIRGELYPEDYLIPFASMRLERPVKWIEDRREHLMAANHSRDIRCELEVAARRDGTIVGLRANVYGDMGAYIRTHGALTACSTAAILTGAYRIPNYQCTVRCVMTNKTGVGTFRGPGRYESCFFRERILDMMAKDLGIDPVELRLKNFLKPDELPHRLGVVRPDGAVTILDSGNYPGVFKRGLNEFGYESLKPLQGCLKDGRYHGIGVAYFVKNTGGLQPYEGARVALGAGPSVALYLSISIMGQGQETAMAQICADTLGLPIEWISVFHGNTDDIPLGWGTYASRSTVMCGSSVYLAANRLRQRLLTVAGRHLNCDPSRLELRDGKIYQLGTEAPPFELNHLVSQVRSFRIGNDGDPELVETAYYNSTEVTYSNGVHLAHVAVDPETGVIEILRYMVVEDIGRCVNPLLAQGQIIGAAVQGIGGTILEELVYDSNGQLLTTTLRDYILPSSTDVPPVEAIILEETPSSTNPLGVKGAGEGGIVGTGGALANAVANALSSLGLEVKELPLSPDKIRALVRKASEGATVW
jgi:carbon-monoxide dehydrogenase large subunit